MSSTRALTLIFGFAFILRVTGVSFGLPYAFHQDEPIVVNHALAYASGDWNPHFFKIPPLLSYLLFGVYVIFYGVLHFFFGWDSGRFAMLFFRDAGPFYLLARVIFGAALGACSVAILYRLAASIFSRLTAFVGALFFAVSYIHVRDSHYVYVDIPMILAVLLVFCALLESLDSKKISPAVKAGFWLGAAVAFKYIAAPLALCVFFALRKEPRKLAAAALTASAAYTLLNPYSFLDGRFFWKEIHDQAGSESMAAPFHHLAYSLVGGEGIFITVFGIAGLIMIFRKRPELRFLSVFPVLWYLVILFFSQSFERYAMPIVPFLCVFCAYFIEEMAGRFSRKASRRAFFIFSTVLCVAFPTAKSVYLDWLVLRPDTRILAKAWILEHIPEGSVISLNQPFFCPRLSQTDNQLDEQQNRLMLSDPQYAVKEKKLGFQKEAAKGQKRFNVYYLRGKNTAEPLFTTWSPWMETSDENLRKAGVRYVVRYRFHEESDDLEPILLRHGRLLKTFSPYFSPEKKETADKISDAGLPFLSRELFSRKFPGPYLEIYQISYQ